MSTWRRGHQTPTRNVRVPDEVWAAAKARAEAEDTTVTAVIVRTLIRYGKGKR